MIASGGFSGYIPFAPGTWGSLVAIGLLWIIGPLPLFLYLLLAAVVIGIGIWICDKAGQVLKIVDSPHIVIDEIAGVMITKDA